MMYVYITVYVIVLLVVIGLAFFSYMIMRGVGFRNILDIYKARARTKKGWGQVMIRKKTGIPAFYPVDFSNNEESGGGIKIGDKVYIMRENCIYFDRFNIPTIEYMEDDAEPIDPRSGIISTLPPEAIGNTLGKYGKALKATNEDIQDFFKNNWGKILVALGIIFGVMGFIIMNLTDQLAECAAQGAEVVRINSTGQEI